MAISDGDNAALSGLSDAVEPKRDPDLQGNPRAGARSCPNEFRRPVASRAASFFEIACFNHRFSYCIGGVGIQKLKMEPSSGGICHPAPDRRILALRGLFITAAA